jgi:hypothetical protein
VEKTVHFPAPETIEAAYRVFLVTPPSGESAGTPEAKQNFISMLSIPLAVGEDRNTQVCWQMALSAASAIQPPVAKAASDAHCEEIVSDGASISVPAGVARMEITFPGGHPLLMEWTSGIAAIVPRTFSAEMSVAVPVPRSSDAPGEFTLRYTVGNGP